MKRQEPYSDIVGLIGLIVANAAFTAPASAQKLGEIMLQPQLVAESPSPKVGEKVQLAIRMTPKPGWHGYWKNSGSPSLKDVYEWELPKGFSVSELRYPVPLKKSLLGVTSHVYEGEYALLVEVQTPKVFVAPAIITLKASYLTCSETVCLPQKTAVSTKLMPGTGALINSNTAQFDVWRSKLSGIPIQTKAYSDETGALRIDIPWVEAVNTPKAWFFADDAKHIDASADQEFDVKAGALSVTVRSKPDVKRLAVTGVMDFGNGKSAAIIASIVPSSQKSQWIGWFAGLAIMAFLALLLMFRHRLSAR